MKSEPQNYHIVTNSKPYGIVFFCITIGISFSLILTSCKGKAEINSIDLTKIAASKSYVEPDTANVFTTLKNQSKLEDKKIFLLFSFKACGICRIFKKYHNDSIVKSILNKYLIVADIDVNLTKGGSVLYAQYGKIGFPSWSIVDSNGKVVVDSEDRESNWLNLGYPDSKSELDYYADALRKAAPGISYSECNILKEKLKYFRK